MNIQVLILVIDRRHVYIVLTLNVYIVLEPVYILLCGHVYIVLEPVGSARLTFGDDQYYEFMCFDEPKFVRSPRCDHWHDEESQNGRDIKIDILEAYVWTSEWFRVSSGIYWSTGWLPGPPGR